MNSKERMALIGIICSITAGLISGFTMIGETATTANVLIVFFSGMAGGASMVSFIRQKKSKKQLL